MQNSQQSTTNTVPMNKITTTCECSPECVLYPIQTQKAGPNQYRWFFSCRECGSFCWQDVWKGTPLKRKATRSTNIQDGTQFLSVPSDVFEQLIHTVNTMNAMILDINTKIDALSKQYQRSTAITSTSTPQKKYKKINVPPPFMEEDDDSVFENSQVV